MGIKYKLNKISIMNKVENIKKQLLSCIVELNRVNAGGESEVYPSMLKEWIANHRKQLVKSMCAIR